MKKAPLLILMFAIIQIGCNNYSKENIEIRPDRTVEKNNFSEIFLGYNDWQSILAISKVATNSNQELLQSKDKFIELAVVIQKMGSDDNTTRDSIISVMIGNRLKTNEDLETFKKNISEFTFSYQLIELLMSDIHSDENVEQMKLFSKKLSTIPDLMHIYDLYMAGRTDMSSLTSVEGVALDLHLSYYLYLQDAATKKEILKRFLLH